MANLLLIIALAGASQATAPDPNPAYAAERAGTQQFQSCAAASPNSIAGSIACHRAELQRQEALLRTALNAALQEVEPNQRAQFNAAQTAWRNFRTQNCAVRRAGGGETNELMYVSCMVRETITRRRELEESWDV